MVPDRHSPNTAAAMHQTPKGPTGSRTGRQQPRGQLEHKGEAGPAKREVVSPKNLKTLPPYTRESSRPRFVPFERRKSPRANHKTARRPTNPQRKREEQRRPTNRWWQHKAERTGRKPRVPQAKSMNSPEWQTTKGTVHIHIQRKTCTPM